MVKLVGILIFAKLSVGVFSLDYNAYCSLLLTKRCLLMLTLDFVNIISIYDVAMKVLFVQAYVNTPILR